MAVESTSASNPFEVNILYKLPPGSRNDASRIKLMHLSMDTAETTTTYFVTPSIFKPSGYDFYMDFNHFGTETDFYMYSGSTNLI